MNVCLVTAPTAAEFRAPEEFGSELVRDLCAEPQLGILSLAAVLELRGKAPHIADLNRIYFDYVRAGEPDANFAAAAAGLIVQHDSDVYGFGSICSGYPLTLRIAEAVKARRPGATVLVGGPQASVVDVQTLAAFPFVDLILRGEAEESLPLLLDELAAGGRFDRVPGLTYRDGCEARRNANGPVIADLDALPSPAYHLTGELQGASRATLELGRGCPFACTFCSTNDFFRRSFRLRSPQRVLRDMRSIAAVHGIRNFELVHDMFTIDRRRVEEFCHAMIASGDGFTWACSARTDRIDEELLDLMRRAGCRSIFFGVETGSARMQRIIDKHLDPRRAAQIVEAAERRGIGTTVSFIMGFPEETADDLRDTVRLFIDSAHWPHADPQLNLLAPLAATPLYWKHRGEMVIEELCSDMSHQGRSQNPADVELIRTHPDIFPNFYLLPTPHLHRGALMELRELMVAAVGRFRWLLCAIEQATTDFLTFFFEWRMVRQRERPGLAGGELRHYYRTGEFVRDFLGFVRRHEVGQTLLSGVFLDWAEALCSPPSIRPSAAARPLSGRQALQWTDLAVRESCLRLVQVSMEIEHAIKAIQQRSEPGRANGPYFYLHGCSDADGLLRRISNWVAWLLEACDGRRNIGQVVDLMCDKLQEVGQNLREYTSLKLIQGAQAEGYLKIYRTDAEAAVSQGGGDFVRPYSETRASASRQNHSSTPRQ
jgi:radical SAM superfamily enzyme YgiQ (UPF0313 family)